MKIVSRQTEEAMYRKRKRIKTDKTACRYAQGRPCTNRSFSCLPVRNTRSTKEFRPARTVVFSCSPFRNAGRGNRYFLRRASGLPRTKNIGNLHATWDERQGASGLLRTRSMPHSRRQRRRIRTKQFIAYMGNAAPGKNGSLFVREERILPAVQQAGV